MADYPGTTGDLATVTGDSDPRPLPTAALPVSVKLLYGLGGMPDSIKAVASGLYLLFFYTTVLGLPARLVGLAAALSLVWDAFIDPYVGRLSDRTMSRLGRRHGWMLIGSIGMAVNFWGLFSPPQGLSTRALFGWLLVLSLLLRTCHSLFAVPYLALGAELQPTYHGRTVLAGYRAAVAQIGAVIASALTLHLFFSAETGAGSRHDAGNYSTMALGLGALMGVAGLLATAGTWSHRPAATVATASTRHLRWRPLLLNRGFILLAASTALFSLSSVFIIGLTLYFLTDYAGVPSAMVSVCQLALHGGSIVGIVCWARLARIFDKHRLHLVACLLTAALVASGFWAPYLPSGLLVPTVLAGYVLAGASSAGLLVLPSSMLADVIEQHRLRSGVQSEGMFFGAFSCCYQVAIGLSTVMASLLVDLYAGVVPGAATQAPQTITRVGILAALVPGAIMALAGAVIVPYNLTSRRLRDMKVGLAAGPTASSPELG